MNILKPLDYNIFQWLLELFGWNPEIQLFSERSNESLKEKINQLKNIKPFVACLSHTNSFAELALFFLYRKINVFATLGRVLISETAFPNNFTKNFGIKHFGAIILKREASTKIKSSTVSNTVKLMKEEEKNKKFIFLVLDPSGNSLYIAPWKTGYYYIAKELGWELRAVGFDFKHKTLKVSDPISSELSIDQVERFLKSRLNMITPYNKNRPIVGNLKERIHHFEYIFSFFLIIYIFICIFFINKIRKIFISN
jgi:hypothetical protein